MLLDLGGWGMGVGVGMGMGFDGGLEEVWLFRVR
jgi:hypothetical protein